MDFQLVESAAIKIRFDNDRLDLFLLNQKRLIFGL